ncbi:hypothetical protein EVAR_98453_1 [Eumeta japonica]|uniref:Uncharacterized protein n=1 Tax=Eumeta variegata TaxID=151549 RepID=A0A4C1YRH3_EUMVA|nr:hypothetical protein EVAR_98453_1 [Eumeta japonica]
MSKPLEEREKFWVDVRDILVKCDRNERTVILGEDKSMIDFIIVDDRLRSKVVGTRVYCDLNIGTDHFLVDPNVKDEYLEQLKDSLCEVKQYECLEFDELCKVTNSVLVDEAKKSARRIFSKAFTCECTVTDDNVTATEYMINDGNESKITMDEIMKALKPMTVGKAVGYDTSFVRDAEGRWRYSCKTAVPAL